MLPGILPRRPLTGFSGSLASPPADGAGRAFWRVAFAGIMVRATCLVLLTLAAVATPTAPAAIAQSADQLATEAARNAEGWQIDTQPSADQAPSDDPAPQFNTTVIPRTTAPKPAETDDSASDRTDPESGRVRLTALLIADGPRIDRGIVWRIYASPERGASSRRMELVSTQRRASPTVQLRPGDYIVNAAFGRAYLNRKITVKAGEHTAEEFVINAGGFRLKAQIGQNEAPENAVSYDIFEGEADQSGNRAAILSNAKPGLIMRLNAGIYHIISRYGDANATISADITVEAGKLTEAVISHSAAKVTFKLTDRPDGEALPGTQWKVATAGGEVVKQSVGALPTHILAPGPYIVTATSGGRAYQQQFNVEDGQYVRVEVLKQ